MNKFKVAMTVNTFHVQLEETLSSFVKNNSDSISYLNGIDGLTGALSSYGHVETWLQLTSFAASTGLNNFERELLPLQDCFDKSSSCSHQTKLDVYAVKQNLELSLSYLLYGQFALSWYKTFEDNYKGNTAMVYRVMSERDCPLELDYITSPYRWLASAIIVLMPRIRRILMIPA